MSSDPNRAKLAPQQPAPGASNRVRQVLVIILGVVVGIVLLATLFVFVGLPALGCPKAGLDSSTGSVSDFCFAPFSGGSHFIGGLAAGPDGNLWFTETGHIGRLTPSGAITEFALPNSENVPGVIVAGPDGNLWFTEPEAKALGRITPAGVVTLFPLPAGDTYPSGLVAGPDGALWYTRSDNNPAGGFPPSGTPGVIGRMSVGGTATEFTLPTPPAPRPPAEPRDIVLGPDGAFWFDTGETNGVASGDSWIGRITTSGQASMVYAPEPQAGVSIIGLAAGPDHNLWFIQTSVSFNTAGQPGPFTSSIGRLTPSGAVKLFPLSPSTSPASEAFVAGPDGNLWFAVETGRMGRITTSGQVTFFPLPDSGAEVNAMADGPGKAVWIVQTYPDTDLLNGIIWGTKVGRVTV